MARTRVRAHRRKGTKGVRQHTRSSNDRVRAFLNNDKMHRALINAMEMRPELSIAQAYILVKVLKYLNKRNGSPEFEFLAEGNPSPYGYEWATRVIKRKYHIADNGTLKAWKRAETEAIKYWGWD